MIFKVGDYILDRDGDTAKAIKADKHGIKVRWVIINGIDRSADCIEPTYNLEEMESYKFRKITKLERALK